MNYILGICNRTVRHYLLAAKFRRPKWKRETETERERERVNKPVKYCQEVSFLNAPSKQYILFCAPDRFYFRSREKREKKTFGMSECAQDWCSQIGKASPFIFFYLSSLLLWLCQDRSKISILSLSFSLSLPLFLLCSFEDPLLSHAKNTNRLIMESTDLTVPKAKKRS